MQDIDILLTDGNEEFTGFFSVLAENMFFQNANENFREGFAYLFGGE